MIDPLDQDQDLQGDLQTMVEDFRGVIETAMAEAHSTGKRVEVTTNMLIMPPYLETVSEQAKKDSGGMAVHKVMRRHRWHWK